MKVRAPSTRLDDSNLLLFIRWLKVRSIEEKTHSDTTDETGNGDGHDPREEQETNSLPVHGFKGTVAKTNTDSGAGDAHGSRDGKFVLRKDEDGNCGAHLHGRTTRRRVVGDFIAHNYSR